MPATTMSLEQILDRVKELKNESSEKDEVIRVQQEQIDELEKKMKSMETELDTVKMECEIKDEAVQKNAQLVAQLAEMLN